MKAQPMSDGIARVTHAIQHASRTPVPRGELVIDRGFARDILIWRGWDGIAHVSSDTALLKACCHCLKLDLACIPAGSRWMESILSPPAQDIPQFVDEGLFIFWLVDGAFEAAAAERGIMTLLGGMARYSGEVDPMLHRLSRQVMANMDRGVTAGAHGIIISDDIAYRHGTYMSPDWVKRYLLPLWQAQVSKAHDLGVPVFLHSDGRLDGVLPLIVAAGFDGLQCIEPGAGMDISAIKTQYEGRLCLMGNVDPALLCDPASTGGATGIDGLRRAVRDVMALGGAGGIIFGTCSGLHSGMRPERVFSMHHMAAAFDPAGRVVSP
jgi:uroporphyrinogen decarboxylase